MGKPSRKNEYLHAAARLVEGFRAYWTQRNQARAIPVRHTLAAPVNLTAVFVQDGPWIAAWIEEIPGVNAQGATMAEARANLRDALALMLEDLRADGERRYDTGHVIIEREQLPVGV